MLVGVLLGSTPSGFEVAGALTALGSEACAVLGSAAWATVGAAGGGGTLERRMWAASAAGTRKPMLSSTAEGERKKLS